MTRPRTAGSLAAALALALAMLFAFGPGSAHAQTAPFTAYGRGLTPGATVTALVKAQTCATATVNADGDWLMQIGATAPCRPSTGDEISFRLNGQATSAVESWRAGGAPADVADGIALVAVADTKPPLVTAPAATTVHVAEGATGAPATTASIASFLAAATASDAVDGSVSVSNDAPAQFPIGTTTVTFSASDAAGNTGTATSTVTVTVSGSAGTFRNPPTGAGVNSALWNGGTVDQLVAAGGSGMQSAWVYEGGKPLGFTVGAPAFVNAAFLALFPGSEIPAGQIMVLIIR